MGYDTMANDASSLASTVAVARDTKKKRGNRSAKLKQSKLDVRREQWLSQVKDGKEVKAVASPTAVGANSGSPILASPHPPLPRRRAETRTRGGEPEEDKEAGGASQEVGSSELDSPMHSPISYNSHGRCMQQKHYSGNGGNHSLNSVSSAWSSSRSVSDAEDEETGGGAREEDGVLDDWEAVADALSVGNNHNHQDSGPEAPPAAPTACPELAHAAARPEPIKSQTRAWSLDDVFWPQSLLQLPHTLCC